MNKIGQVWKSVNKFVNQFSGASCVVLLQAIMKPLQAMFASKKRDPKN